jgi:hypothetical protein
MIFFRRLYVGLNHTSGKANGPTVKKLTIKTAVFPNHGVEGERSHGQKADDQDRGFTEPRGLGRCGTLGKEFIAVFAFDGFILDLFGTKWALFHGPSPYKNTQIIMTIQVAL